MTKLGKVGFYLPVALCFFIPISTSLTTITFLAILALFVIDGRYKAKLEYYIVHPLTPILLMLLGLTLFSSLFSIGSSESIFERFKDMVRLSFIPIVAYYISSQRQIYYSFYVFILAMILTLVLGFAKVYLELPIGEKYTEGAVFKSHIESSFFMSIAAFYVLFLAFNHKRYRIWLAILAALMIHYVFFMSMGRIGYLALFFIGAYVAHHYLGKKGLLLAAIAILIAAASVYQFSDVFQVRINLLVQDWDYYQQNRLLESSLGSRIQFYLTSLTLISQKPILGWGSGAFGQAYQNLSQGAYLFTDNPHNQFLLIGVELGLIGLILLVALFIRQWQLTHQTHESWRVIARGTLLLFVMGCMINSWLIDFSMSYFFMMYSVMNASQYTSYKPGDLIKVPLH